MNQDRNNLQPPRAWPDQKIGAAVALMMAIGRGLVHDQNEAGPPSLYPSSRLPLHARISDRRSAMDGQSHASILAGAVQFPVSRHWLRMERRQHRAGPGR